MDEMGDTTKRKKHHSSLTKYESGIEEVNSDDHPLAISLPCSSNRQRCKCLFVRANSITQVGLKKRLEVRKETQIPFTGTVDMFREIHLDFGNVTFEGRV